MKGCKVCGMPHSSAAHQRAIRSVGGYVGGQRDYNAGVGGSKADRIGEPTNQTIFLGRGALDDEKNVDADGFYHMGRYPVYPEPQSIRGLPLQNAGFDDFYNTRGQAAAIRNLGGIPEDTKKFLRDINTVYINPLYKRDLVESRLPADRLERKAKKYENLDKAVQRFAAANSKYFDKTFEVLPAPKVRRSNVFNNQVANPMKTLQLDIQGYHDPEGRTLGSVPNRNMVYARKGDSYWNILSRGYSDYYDKKVHMNRGADPDQPASPYLHTINMNTGREGQRVREQAFVLQHEFGHVLGRPHSDRFRDNDANTVMSYDSYVRDFGEQLLPSDINLYRAAYKAIENKPKKAARKPFGKAGVKK